MWTWNHMSCLSWLLQWIDMKYMMRNRVIPNQAISEKGWHTGNTNLWSSTSLYIETSYHASLHLLTFFKTGSFTAYETDDVRSGKVVYASWCSWCKVLCLWRCWCRKGANSCATILGKWWRKIIQQVAGKRGCCFWGAMTPKPRSVFFLCDFSISTSFTELLSMFILHSVIQQCINSFPHWSIVLCMLQCILCFICLFFISSNVFLIH